MVPALLTALVYAFVWNDAREKPLPDRAAWERFLERAWAVIVIDFAAAYVASIGAAGTASADAAAIGVGIVAMIASVLILFADVAATVDDDGTVWSLVPRAFLKSAAVAFRPSVLVRAIAIFAFQLLILAAQESIQLALTGAHVPNAEVWSTVPLPTLLVPPVAALTLLVYRDAALSVPGEREPRR